MFYPTLVENLEQLRSFPFESVVTSNLSRFIANCEVAEKKVVKKVQKLLAGETKRALTEWWLGQITEHSMEFLLKM